MKPSTGLILHPAGDSVARHAAGISPTSTAGRKPRVGLLNNSKPNVAIFLAALEGDLQAEGYDTLNVTKPRSAGPCPELDGLALQCDYVINAVAE